MGESQHIFAKKAYNIRKAQTCYLYCFSSYIHRLRSRAVALRFLEM